MRPAQKLSMMFIALGFAAGARAAPPPEDTLHELRQAEHELAQAALLRAVAQDRFEAQHLLAARDLLREAEANLSGPLRERAQRLDWDIGREVGASVVEATPPRPGPLGPVSVLPPLDRADLGALALRAQTLVAQAQTSG